MTLTRHALLAGAAVAIVLGAATQSQAQYYSDYGRPYAYAPAPYPYRAYDSYAYAPRYAAPRYRYVSPRYRNRAREDHLTGTGAGLNHCYTC